MRKALTISLAAVTAVSAVAFSTSAAADHYRYHRDNDNAPEKRVLRLQPLLRRLIRIALRRVVRLWIEPVLRRLVRLRLQPLLRWFLRQLAVLRQRLRP